MEIKPANVNVLTEDITIEILKAFGLPKSEFWQNTIGKFFHKPARRFSEIFARFDTDIATYGISEAVRRLLPIFVEKTTALGTENIPTEGPLLVVSNHPGTFDGLSIISNTPRDDFKVIVGGMTFLKKLPVATTHLIHTPHPTETSNRANVVRAGIRHLEDGGALLIFPSGRIDPDPAVLPGCFEALSYWSKSIAIMLRRVPDTYLLPAITSGVLHERFTHSWLTFLQRDDHSKRRIMEFLQVMRQLILGEKFGLQPFITFDKPLTLQDLGGMQDADEVFNAILAHVRQLLNRHLDLLSTIKPGMSPVDA